MKGGGYALKLPVIDISEVGAGGGSIVRLDRAGMVKVGPDSAGAVPGPACYGMGGTAPTVTDANVVLGYLNPVALADGAVPIDAALAQLELRAREKGSAIGFVNAAPEALTRIGRFLAGLEKRGLALAPVSAVLAPVVTTATTPNAGKEASKNHKHNQEQKP